MSTPAVLIIANPFEAQVVRRAVEAAGLRPLVCEGGQGAGEQLRGERAAVLVLAQSLFFADDDEVQAAIVQHAAGVPLLLLSEAPEDEAPAPSLVVAARVRRPIDAAALERRLRELARPAEPSGPWLVTSAGVVDEVEAAGGDEGAAPLSPAGEAADHWLSPPEEPLFAGSPGAADVDDADDADEEDRAPLASAGSVSPRQGLLRLDEAVEGELIVKRPTVKVEPITAPLDERILEVDRQLRRTDPRRGAQVGAGGDGLAIDSIPGFDSALGLGGPATSQVQAAPPAASDPARQGDLVGQALAVLVPGRAAALTRGTLRDAQATPELDEGNAVADLPDAGELARESVAELVTRLHRAGFTGRLALRRGEADKSIFFDGGFPVHATSSLPYDRLAELLWREGKITRDQHAQGRQFPGSGRRAIEFLVEIGALKRDETFKVMRHLVEEIIYSCFAWDRGGWSIGRDVAARDDKVSVAHPYALVLEGIRRKYPLERLVQAVGPASTRVQGSQTLWRVSADAGLAAPEREAIQLLRRGAKTVQELRTAGRLDEISAYAVVHGLQLLGALGRSEVAATDEMAPHGADEAAVDRDRALAKYAQVVDGDYFGVLGVSRNASAYEIRRAWERTRADFAPERFEQAVRDELAERLREIREVVDEAYRALSDDLLRDAYRSHLVVT